MAAWCLEADRPVVYDIGANIGFVATQLAQMLANQQPRIIAFEPVPSTFRRLNRSIRSLGLLDEVTPVDCGISDRAGFVSVAFSDTQPLYAQVSSDSENLRAGRI